MDHEEHVELVQPDRIDREEIRGQHDVGLGTQELGPGGPLPWDGPETMSAQDPADRAGRDADPELLQFTLYAHASPAPVLPTETNDQLD